MNKYKIILFLSVFVIISGSNCKTIENDITGWLLNDTEKSAKTFVQKTDLANMYFIILNLSPGFAEKYNINDKLKKIINENFVSECMSDEILLEDPFVYQSVLDSLYISKVLGMDNISILSDKNLKNHYEDKGQKGVLQYIYFRILKELSIINLDESKVEKEIVDKCKEDPFYYGYFLTHKILYDSRFFKEQLNIKDYQKEISELKKISNYAVNNNKYDLACEIYLCFNRFFLFNIPEFKMLEALLFNEKMHEIVKNGSVHLKVVFFAATMAKHEYLPVKKGFINNGNKKNYFELYGRNKKNKPIVLISGGPGWSHDIMLPLLEISKNRQVLLYDQIGTGQSTNVDDWSKIDISVFVKELENIINDLQLEKPVILGHSWGSMIAIDYTLKHQFRVSALILASPVISANDWIADTQIKYKKLRNVYSKEYEINEIYNKKYIIENIDIYKHVFLNFNENMYFMLWGKSEYNLTGYSIRYERKKSLNKIKIPILFTKGEHDEMTNDTLFKWASLPDESTVKIFKNTRHCHYIEQNDMYVEYLNKWFERFGL